ncbi:MAG: anti-sigma factor family protein [Fimbriimonas sp.]
MNGKFEERLARLAFGDVTPEEARGLEREAQGNPEAARILNEFRDMRAGLRDLGADVPPDQLSKERLRDAILGQGLRPAPVPVASNRGWLWMPVLAGALAFGIFTFRGGSGEKAPMVVMDDSRGPSFVAQLPEPTPTLSLPTDVPEVRAASSRETPAKPVLKVASQPTPVPKQTRRRNRPRKPIVIDSARYAFDVRPNEVTGGDLEQKGEPSEVPETPKTDPTPVAMTASAPIVLIDSGKNSETGASTATEVGTASNVLVGG